MTDIHNMELTAREEEIVDAIKHKDGVRIKDLAKLLGMWDGNLRNKINDLVKMGIVEKFIKDKYICDRFV